MDLEELIIDHDSTSEDFSLSSLTNKICSFFKLGEWKKALSLSKQYFTASKQNLQSTIEIYKSGCALSCRIIELKNIKLGIHIMKRLNKFIAHLDPDNFIQYQCEVLNYVACVYKQAQKPYLARKYIDRAMRIVEDFKHVLWDKSGTYLNMCAILSAAGKHNDAIVYARTAISLAREELVNLKINKDSEELKNKASVLGIAYHNYAVEEEFLGNLKAALGAYEKAVSILEKYVSGNAEMLIKFKNSCMDVKKILFRTSRPNSAKSVGSNKTFISVKSSTAFKTSKSKDQNSKKPSKQIQKKNDSQTDNDFLQFKDSCKDFLTSKKDWFNSSLSLANKSSAFKSKTQSIAPIIKTRHISDPIKADFRIENITIITTPIKGIENYRKPIFHEVSFSSTKNKILDTIEIVDEKKEFKNNKNTKIKFSAPSSKKTSFFKNEPVIIEDFDKIKTKEKNDEESGNESDKVKAILVEEAKKDELQRKMTLKRQTTLKPIGDDRATQLKKLESLICKLQAHFRGAQAREKYKLIKARKSQLLYRGAKKIQGLLSIISILRQKNQRLAILTNGFEDHKLVISEELTAQEIFERIDKNEKGIFLSKNELKDKLELVKTVKMKISDEDCEVKLLFDSKTEILIVRSTKYSNSRVYTIEKKNMTFKSRALLIRYAQDEILPFLKFVGQKLIIDKVKEVSEREFLAKGSRIMQKKEFDITANKIVTEEGYNIEFIAETPGIPGVINEVFLVEEILKSIQSLGVTSIEADPHATFLPLHYQDNHLILRQLDEKLVSCIYTSTSNINNSDYCIKVYKIQDDCITYHFQAHNPESPNVSSFSITDKDLCNIYKITNKKIKASIQTIVKKISIKSGKLLLTSASIRAPTIKDNTIPFILKFQALIRGHLARDRLKFTTPRGSLLYQEEKHINGVYLFMNFFKVEEALVVELLCPDVARSYYFMANDPKKFFSHFSRIFDLKCIAKTLCFDTNKFKIVTQIGHVEFMPCSYFSQEELKYRHNSPWPAFYPRFNIGAEYYFLAREFTSKCLIVKAIPRKYDLCPHRVFSFIEISEHVGGYKPLELLKMLRLINGNIILGDSEVNNIDRISSSGDRIVYRTCKQISGKLYQVLLSTTGEDDEEIMNFILRQGSMANKSKNFQIPVLEACEKTGFSRSYLIPMADYMIRHMLIISEDQCVLDENVPPFDINKAILKIQSIFRGYLVRKKTCKHLSMKCLARAKVKLNTSYYTILLYLHNEDYEIFAVHNIEVFTLTLQKSIIESHLNNIEKFFVSKIVPKLILKEKDNKWVLGGLKALKKIGNDLSVRRRTISSNSNSSAQTPRSFRDTVKSTSSSKNLKWRAPRLFGDDKCLVSIYEEKEKGIVEVLFMNTDRVMSLDIDKGQIENPEILAEKLEINGKKLEISENNIKHDYSEYKLF
ncbi:hypothetical protein SteCoe_13036 [Stentor coeruleus]|uniref:EF-hand domain-containing protein n=1 Tax=Stentor coeruleus TaxID=5963 RepID=A0A1R2C9D7_9CILI|nr:hypothetical protein SteCoe_13036 [Stentor coeruleus]